MSFIAATLRNPSATPRRGSRLPAADAGLTDALTSANIISSGATRRMDMGSSACQTGAAEVPAASVVPLDPVVLSFPGAAGSVRNDLYPLFARGKKTQTIF